MSKSEPIVIDGLTDEQREALFAKLRACGMRDFTCVCGAAGLTLDPSSNMCPPCREKARQA